MGTSFGLLVAGGSPTETGQWEGELGGGPVLFRRRTGSGPSAPITRPASSESRRSRFEEQGTGNRGDVIVLAASTVAIVAIAAAVIVALGALVYLLPRGGRRRR